MKKILMKLLMVLAVATGTFLFFSAPALAAQTYHIPDGVEVEGIDLSGMTQEEARAALVTFVDQVKSGTLKLTAGEDVVEIPLSEIGLDVADASVIDNLSKIGSGGNIIRRYKELTDVKNHNASYKISFVCSRDQLTAAISARADQINRQPQDATIVRHDGQLIITEELIGRNLKIEETADSVMNTLAGEWDKTSLTAAVIMEETPAVHTAEELSVIQDCLATYTTSYGGSSSNRVANIQNGAAKIDETTLYPGDTFSFTQAVAPFTAENGYYLAGAYASGKNVDSMGGGICQVSSTLYNTVLRAELTIVERTNHMMTVGYVPLAADATIAEPTIDFKFRNDYDFPVYIEAYTYNGSVTVAIYGKETRPANRTVEFESVTEQTIAPPADVVTEDLNQPEGYEDVTQSAHTGYVAALYKCIYVDGVLESRALVNRSTYQAYPRYVTKGTKQPETEPPETQAPPIEVPPTEEPPVQPPQVSNPENPVPPDGNDGTGVQVPSDQTPAV